MYSNRSEHTRSRQYSDGSSRQWDGYGDRWEERHEPHRDIQWDSYQKYGRDGHSSKERACRSRENSDSPTRLYSIDSLNRDRTRKSPVRRRMSSPDWGLSEKKRRRFTEGDEDHNRYRRMPEDKASRQSSESFSRSQKDFKHKLPKDEDFKYKKSMLDSRHRYQHEEFSYRQQYNDLTCRRSSGCYKDRDGHERSLDRSQERTRSQDRSTKTYGKPREGNDSPSTDHEDHRQNTRFPLNVSRRQSFENHVLNQSAAVPEKSSNGFQRFLDVLNKGVNVTTLAKIVTQTSPEMDVGPDSLTSVTNTADSLWSSNCAGGQKGSLQNTSYWSGSEGSHRLTSPQPCHRSFSPKGRSPSEEGSLQRGDGECSYVSSNSRSESPSVVTPEDEHKHRQMQDVLQAIGMNLGLEELGQMSHRIQERLYGKKQSDGGSQHRGSREREKRQAFSPRRQSGSSSSRSSSSPSTQDYNMKKDTFSAQSDVTGVLQPVEYGQNSNSTNFQESDKCETNSEESTAASQTFSQNPTYTLPELSPAPVMQMYPPVNNSRLPYAPNLPHVGPRLFLPRQPPLLPYPHIPPLNIFPAVLAQTRYQLPQYFTNPQPLLNLPIPPLNTTQKSKTLSRPRCLQVIETKQPG